VKALDGVGKAGNKTAAVLSVCGVCQALYIHSLNVHKTL
jgi:hypothetical protein